MFRRTRNRFSRRTLQPAAVVGESLEPLTLLSGITVPLESGDGDAGEDRLQALIDNGSIAADPADGLRVPTDASGRALVPLVTDTFDQAIPSNDWWSSVHFPAFNDRFSAPLHVHPVTVQPTGDGFQFGAPQQLTGFDTGPATREYKAYTQYALQVRLFGNQVATDFALEDYGDWSFTGRWRGTAAPTSLTLAQGSPLAWSEDVDFSKMRIQWASVPTEISVDSSRAFVTVNRQTYGLSVDAPARFVSDASGLFVEGRASGALSVALLPNDTPEMRTTFSKVAMNRPSSTRFSFEADASGTNLRVEYEFLNSEGDESETLLALYPHLRRLAADTTDVSDAAFVSSRGPMQQTSTSRFQIDVPARGVLPNLPDVLSDTEREELRQLVVADSVAKDPNEFLSRFSDTYWSGKAMLRLSQLSQLAEIVGENEIRDGILEAVKSELDDWFTASGASNDKHFAWNQSWNTVQGYPDSFGSADGLNDHHFHYGYFVHAAAIVGLHDREWAMSHRDMVDVLIMDVAGFDSQNDAFPVLRNFSAMAGHSWASGHGAFASGNNQESSSEAMNFATGMMLWGQLTENSETTSVGQMLYSLEAEAIAEYWFDRYSSVFPESFHAESVGMVWGDGAAHATWFSAEPELIKAINFLPFHGGSMYLSEMARDPAALLAEIEAMNGGAADDWSGLLLQYQALIDPAGALQSFDETAPVYEDGQSEAYTWYWLKSLARIGTPTSVVRSDHPLSMVFESETARTYTVSNTSNAALSVQFSDSTSVGVPANTERTMQRIWKTGELIELNSRTITDGGEDPDPPGDNGPELTIAWPTPNVVMMTGTQSGMHGNVADIDGVARLEATLQHLESGKYWRTNGQFGTADSHDVQIVDNAGHWRLMFAPPAPGNWELIVTAIDDAGNTASKSTTFKAIGDTLVDPGRDNKNPDPPGDNGPELTIAWPTPNVVMMTGTQSGMHGNVADIDEVVSLKATLQHLESGKYWRTNGQFGTADSHDVQIVDNAGHWRLMFAPPAPGNWELIVTAINDAGNTASKSTTFKAIGDTLVDPGRDNKNPDPPGDSGPDFNIAWPNPEIRMMTGVENAMHGNVADIADIFSMKATLQHVKSEQFWRVDESFGPTDFHAVRIVDNAGHWRLMFAPPAPGKWELVVTATNPLGQKSVRSTTFFAIGDTLVDPFQPPQQQSTASETQASGSAFSVIWPEPKTVMVVGIGNAIHGEMQSSGSELPLKIVARHLETNTFLDSNSRMGQVAFHEASVPDDQGRWHWLFTPPIAGKWQITIRSDDSSNSPTIRTVTIQVVSFDPSVDSVFSDLSILEL